MNDRLSGARPPASKSASHLLTLAIFAVLAASQSVSAQTTPYQASQRYSVGSGLGQMDAPKGLVFEPRVEAAIQYVSNIALAPDDQEKVDTAGIELSPGFYASYSSGLFLGAIDYSLIGRAWDESDYNDVSHRLAANGEWYAVPEWFSLRGQASYRDTVIDPLQGGNYGGMGIFNTGNLGELATASISPVLSHQFGDLQFQADYNYGRTWYLDEGKGQPTVGFVFKQDSTDQAANVSIGTAKDAGSRLSATAFYQWNKSEYDTALPYQYERAGLDLGYRFARTLSLAGDVGKESDLDASTTQGGLDSDFWSAGLKYQPNDRTTAEARYGNRFFGDSWSASISHRARIVEFDASYREEPTVETRRLSLGAFNPGQLPPGLPPGDYGRINSSPYIAKNASVGIRAIGSRTTIGLSAYQYDRDYLRVQRADEQGTGVGLLASRQLGSNLSADFDVSYREYERSFDPASLDPNLTGKSRDTTTTFRLNRTTGRTLTLSAEAGYLVRNREIDADGWWVGLRGRWTPWTTSNPQ